MILARAVAVLTHCSPIGDDRQLRSDYLENCECPTPESRLSNIHNPK
jgi:hypothetical protein